MSIGAHSQKTPPVRVTQADYERLAPIAEHFHTEGATLLRRELDRARVVAAPRAGGARFVRIGSLVEYRDLLNGRGRRVELTLPNAADIDAGRLSVAAPVGAALLGLAAGDTFGWTGADGRPHLLEVLWVGDAGQDAPAATADAAASPMVA